MLSRSLALVVALVICGPASAYAQTEASIVGTVTDESRAALPGVSVTATEVSTGRQHMAVTDARGEYRLLPMQPGTYRVQAELPGFATVVVPKVELLVGQNATINLAMKVAAIQETLTVTGEAPLADTRSTQLAGNVDRRQMDELPILGRNWAELSMLVKGVTGNAVTHNRPGVSRDPEFQLSLDGQEVKQNLVQSHHGQPRFSREAIAEFRVVTNLFDVTQGRSTGIAVQAISRSGTNTLSGSFYGNFRDDRFNSVDFVANQVLLYSNQQVGGAVGGPIVRDKIHYFATYEYERESDTVVMQPSALLGQRFVFPRDVKNHSFLARADFQLSRKDRLTIRGSKWNYDNPFTEAAGTAHPTVASHKIRHSTTSLATWTRILSESKVQEVRVSYNDYAVATVLAAPQMANTPTYVFPSLSVGGLVSLPQDFQERTPAFRYDLTWHRGRHDLKIGGEYFRWHDTGGYRPTRLARGQFVFTANPPDLARRFPADAWDDPTRWDLTGLDPLVQRFDQNFGDGSIDIPRPNVALWIGDTWSVSNKLTLNLGVRWDDDWNATAPPWIIASEFVKTDIRDHNNVQPRVGFTYKLNDENDWILRGGTGLFYGAPSTPLGFQLSNSGRQIIATFLNDGRPGFIQDPRRGVTSQDILSGGVPLPTTSLSVFSPDFGLPSTWQSVLGSQKQLSQVIGAEADLVYSRVYDAGRTRDLNLFYDSVTGYNLDPRRFGRPYPQYNEIDWQESSGSGDYLALATGITRRYANNFQGGLTYTLMFFKHDNYNFQGPTAGGNQVNNQFDLDAEWARANDFQRHTLRATGIYRLPWGGISLAGAYFFGSGNYYLTTIGTRPFGKPGLNRLNVGAPISIPADVLDRFEGPSVIGTGQVVPRHALKGKPLHKVDLRVSKEFRLGGQVKLTGMAEVFNLFNHANYGAYNGLVNSSTFGQPSQELNNAYVPRMGQFAFRLTF